MDITACLDLSYTLANVKRHIYTGYSLYRGLTVIQISLCRSSPTFLYHHKHSRRVKQNGLRLVLRSANMDSYCQGTLDRRSHLNAKPIGAMETTRCTFPTKHELSMNIMPLGATISLPHCYQEEDSKWRYNVTILRNVRVIIFPWESNKHYTHCVSAALVIQHAKHTRHIVLSSVACLALPYFSTLPHYNDFMEKVTQHRTCVSIFSTTFVRNISHSKSEILSEMNIGLREKYSWHTLMTLGIFSTYCRKISKYINFKKIRPVGAEFYVVGRTDMSELIVTFRNFVTGTDKFVGKEKVRSKLRYLSQRTMHPGYRHKSSDKEC
jgi:hypothetical protein